MTSISPKVIEAYLNLARSRSPTQLSAEEVVSEALKRKTCIGWSGGRCSTVALWLTLDQDPDIPVVFNNTGIEYPETVEYVRRYAKEWHLNFYELKPEKTFWELVKIHGFPQLRGSSKISRPRKPACCTWLKEKPLHDFMKEKEIEGLITGIRAEESRPRCLSIAQHGQFQFVKRDGFWKFHPVSLWSLKELMEYVEKYEIPLNPLYSQGYNRIGCMPCTGFSYWRQQLAKHQPKYYRWLNKEYLKSKKDSEGKFQVTMWEYDQNDSCVQTVEEASL